LSLSLVSGKKKKKKRVSLTSWGGRRSGTEKKRELLLRRRRVERSLVSLVLGRKGLRLRGWGRRKEPRIGTWEQYTPPPNPRTLRQSGSKRPRQGLINHPHPDPVQSNVRRLEKKEMYFPGSGLDSGLSTDSKVTITVQCKSMVHIIQIQIEQRYMHMPFYFSSGISQA
jgi:hypothetical protein